MNLTKNQTSKEYNDEINTMYLRAIETKLAILNDF